MEQMEHALVTEAEEKATPSNELALFRGSLENILRQVSSAVSLEKFSEIFSDVSPLVNKPNRLKSLWELFQQTMLDDMLLAMDDFICDELLDEKLKIIAEMQEKCDAGKGQVAWRPTLLSIEQYLRAYDIQSKKHKQIKLEELAEKKEQRVQQLRMKVTVERSKVNKFHAAVEKAKETLKKEYKKDRRPSSRIQHLLIENESDLLD